MSAQNHDLQTFFNNFHKEIEDGNSTVVTLTSENVADLTDGDTVVQKILMDNDDDDEGADDGKTTFYLDEDGNCFVQKETKKTKTTTNKVATSPKQTRSYHKTKVNVANSNKRDATKSKDTKKVDYVIELKNEEDVELDGEGNTNSAEVYNFDENTNESEEDGSDTDYVIEKKVMKLKPVSNSSKNDNVEYKCKHCDYKTNKHTQLQRHLRTHNDDRPFKCSVCERGFKSNVSLVNHVNVHLGNRPHQCKQCTRKFTTRSELIRHVRYKHTGEKPHKCSECGFACVELSKLRRHIRCHTGERPYQCPHCTYASPDTFKLKRHIRVHTGEKPYECDICKARFTQSNSLKSHKLIHSVVDKPVFQCTLCPTTCGRKSDLRMHMQNLHQSDKPIPCKRCGKELPDRYSYKLHVKTHNGERCYRCELCPYASISQRHLESHMLLHTDEKPFKCTECDLDFRQRQLLKRHINVYHNKDYVPPDKREKREKLHSCPNCKRTFTHRGNLMRHMELYDKNSEAYKNSIALKEARSLRLQADGTIVNLEDKEESEDIIMSDRDLDTDDFVEENEEAKGKSQTTSKIIIDNSVATVINIQKPSNKSTSSFKVKKEPISQEILSVEVDGEEEYMVLDVVDCDEDDEEDIESAERIVVKTEIEPGTIVNATNCFGFELDEAEEDKYIC